MKDLEDNIRFEYACIVLVNSLKSLLFLEKLLDRKAESRTIEKALVQCSEESMVGFFRSTSAQHTDEGGISGSVETLRSALGTINDTLV